MNTKSFLHCLSRTNHSSVLLLPYPPSEGRGHHATEGHKKQEHFFVILETKWFANVYKVSNLVNINFQSRPISIEYKT
jgi:hypothetical protein